jgi:acetoacetyl-CoA synthetase
MSARTGRPLAQGDVLWEPPADARERFELGRYLEWLRSEHGLDFRGYEEAWRWSVSDLEAFWASIWDFYEVRAHTPYERVLGSREMPGAEWFPGARLNYAEHMLGRDEDVDAVAVVAYSQTREPMELTFGDLREQVARARVGLKRLGVGPGDRVVAYLPNIPETLVAFIATASLGAIWATCPPEFGARSVLHRLGQLEPKVLLAVAGYRYGEKLVDRREQVAEIRAGLPSLETVVHVPYLGGADDTLSGAVSWDALLAQSEPLAFEPLPFSHPLYVLFSSGTTGLPKAIVHCHGGILLEHLKNHGFSWDLKPGDRLQWFTTTAWMMWNALVSVLLLRASIVMIDGNPGYPDLSFQWRLIEETRPTFFGLSPAFTMACRKEGLQPGALFDLSSVRMVCEAGSPLPLEGYEWLYEQFGPDVNVNVGSGGTDVCTGLVQGYPLLPVWAGEMSARMLGADVDAFGPDGKPVVGELGELVIKQPMPSMPVAFWGDRDGSRYREAYFEFFPGVWRFGDWILFTERGSAVITGRSDATLNRGGVRLGSSEIYSVVEEIDEVLDSLVVHLEEQDELLLFVVLRPGLELDDELRKRIAGALRNSLSPRHAPDTIVAVPAIPRTLTGKKLEVPVKRILTGAEVSQVASSDALVEPSSIEPFAEYARTREQPAAPTS